MLQAPIEGQAERYAALSSREKTDAKEVAARRAVEDAKPVSLGSCVCCGASAELHAQDGCGSYQQHWIVDAQTASFLIGTKGMMQRMLTLVGGAALHRGGQQRRNRSVQTVSQRCHRGRWRHRVGGARLWYITAVARKGTFSATPHNTMMYARTSSSGSNRSGTSTSFRDEEHFAPAVPAWALAGAAAFALAAAARPRARRRRAAARARRRRARPPRRRRSRSPPRRRSFSRSRSRSPPRAARLAAAAARAHRRAAARARRRAAARPPRGRSPPRGPALAPRRRSSGSRSRSPPPRGGSPPRRGQSHSRSRSPPRRRSSRSRSRSPPPHGRARSSPPRFVTPVASTPAPPTSCEPEAEATGVRLIRVQAQANRNYRPLGCTAAAVADGCRRDQ